MMKKIIPIVVFLMTIGVAFGASDSECKGGSGNIWATHEDGSREDYFLPGDPVYISGQNFDPDTTYDWNITNQSFDGPVKPAVAQGQVTTDGNGDIPQTWIWTFPSGEYDGHFRLNLRYNDCTFPIYTKKDTFLGEEIPEFPTVAIPAVLAVGGYLVLRKKRRKPE